MVADEGFWPKPQELSPPGRISSASRMTSAILCEVRQVSYYFSTILDLPFDDAVAHATDALKSEGFGVLTDIDVSATLKKKLDVDFRSYRILGACNPPFAHKALLSEDKIGTMLPCNVILQQTSEGVEVAAVDPTASMQAVDNPELFGVAQEVQARLRRVIDSL
jgi:uncharacterized protein (DUF302 family)